MAAHPSKAADACQLRGRVTHASKAAPAAQPLGLGAAPADPNGKYMSHNQVAEAMSYRVKYRIDPINFKRRQPLSSMGFIP